MNQTCTIADGTFVSMISVPDGEYQVSITGIGDGTFHLVTGTDNAIVNYGEQPIKSGEQAIFTLKSADLNQPLELADKSTVTPQPGFPEGDGDSDSNGGGSGGSSGGGCFINSILK